MRVVTVRAPGGRYPVRIGRGVIGGLGGFITRRLKPSGLHLVTDSRVGRHHGARVGEILAGTGLLRGRTVLRAGETSKTIASLERIWRDVARKGLDRRGCLIALGGGVVGDMTGFAAASTLRGIDFVQIPTTILAMVDASVGGKTGINLPEGKNLVGAFHQPRAVFMDLDFLATLPRREAAAGWAEVIKTAAIRDARLFRRLERESDRLLAGDPEAVGAVVAACVRIKASVVEEDEREAGLRMILNFGHTLAHGIETSQGYGELLHGEAVAVGMRFAARLGERLGHTPLGVADRLERLLGASGLPLGLREARTSRILSAMLRDKKRGPRGLRWVFLEEIGRAVVDEDVPLARVKTELADFLARR